MLYRKQIYGQKSLKASDRKERRRKYPANAQRQNTKQFVDKQEIDEKSY